MNGEFPVRLKLPNKLCKCAVDDESTRRKIIENSQILTEVISVNWQMHSSILANTSKHDKFRFFDVPRSCRSRSCSYVYIILVQSIWHLCNARLQFSIEHIFLSFAALSFSSSMRSPMCSPCRHSISLFHLTWLQFESISVSVAAAAAASGTRGRSSCLECVLVCRVS